MDAYAARATEPNLEIPKPRIRLRKQDITDGHVVTFIFTVQQIMTTVKTAMTEDERFSIVVKDVYGLVMRK
jgi:hypothetical protein